jgi:hypothetical protein
MHAKKVVVVLEPFFSFMFSFQTPKLTTCQNNVRSLIQRVGVGHLVCWKGKALQIASAYDRHVMFLLFICAFTFLNLSDASEKALSNFAFLSFQLVCMITWKVIRIWRY